MKKESFSLPIDGLRIRGEIYLPAGKKEKSLPVLCFCHGIPSRNTAAVDDGGYPALADMFVREGFLVAIFNFRGCGISDGNFDILGWTRDLQTVVNYLYPHPYADQKRFSLMGFSGGAAVSIYVAGKDSRISSLAACASPADFENLLNLKKPEAIIDQFRSAGIIREAAFPPSVEEWMDSFRKVRPLDHIKKISPRPLFLLHGKEDDLVPPSHAQRLFAAAKEPRTVCYIKGAGHRLRLYREAMETARDWLKAINK